jgi:hypothetical protein
VVNHPDAFSTRCWPTTSGGWSSPPRGRLRQQDAPIQERSPGTGHVYGETKLISRDAALGTPPGRPEYCACATSMPAALRWRIRPGHAGRSHRRGKPEPADSQARSPRPPTTLWNRLPHPDGTSIRDLSRVEDGPGPRPAVNSLDEYRAAMTTAIGTAGGTACARSWTGRGNHGHRLSRTGSRRRPGDAPILSLRRTVQRRELGWSALSGLPASCKAPGYAQSHPHCRQ